MYVKHITIDNFRNINTADIEFNRNFNILSGDNGQGKTNTIECIYLTLTGKSHRENVIDNFISNSYREAKTEAKVVYDDGSEYAVKMTIGADKKYTIDEEPVKKRYDLTKNFALIFFSPDDLNLIKGGPAERRLFLNDAIAMVAPKYAIALSNYAKILKQRNTLLKEYTPSCGSLLEVYDESLIQYGSMLIKYRILFLKEFEKQISKLYSQISEDKEKISLSYVSNIFEDKISRDIEGQYKKALAQSRDKDIQSGFSLVGAHHDDINILLNGRTAKKFASQGQQRSIALCMKLSLIELIYEKNKEKPVVLLDDVMSELDEKRQEMIIQMLSGIQTFITCVNYNFMDKQKNKTIYKAQNGSLSKVRVN